MLTAVRRIEALHACHEVLPVALTRTLVPSDHMEDLRAGFGVVRACNGRATEQGEGNSVFRKPIVLVLAVANVFVFALVSAELVAGVASQEAHQDGGPARHIARAGRTRRHGPDSRWGRRVVQRESPLPRR